MSEIVTKLREYGLTDTQTELALEFLKKYFFELDENKNKVRLVQSCYDLFRE